MVQNIIEHRDFLKSLARHSKHYNKRRFILGEASPKQIKALQEVVYNVAKSHVPLTKCQINKLRKGKYKKAILTVSNRKGSTESKRKIFVQKGGFLQYILPAALLLLKDFI
nr:TPA_asm: gasderminX [Orchesella springtail adintovirus]